MVPLASLLLPASVLPSCGGGLTSTTKPTTPTSPAPTVASITPNTGTSNGGTTITITGIGFLTGATVSFGGTQTTNVTLAGSTSITATAPAHAPGAIRILDNVVLQPGNFLDIQGVTNFDGQEQGLLGLAFHPNFATNHKFYVNYTLDQLATFVIRQGLVHH